MHDCFVLDKGQVRSKIFPFKAHYLLITFVNEINLFEPHLYVIYRTCFTSDTAAAV